MRNIGQKKKQRTKGTKNYGYGQKRRRELRRKGSIKPT
jgi:hypothetical protein